MTGDLHKQAFRSQYVWIGLGLAFLIACIPPVRAGDETGMNLEALVSDDISLADCSAYFLRKEADYKTVLSYQHTDYRIEYRPPADSLIGIANERYTTNDSLRVSTQGPAGRELLWLAEGGGYLGFSDFQSLWLDEYYRQLFENYSGYKEHNPMGFDGLVGLRWDYLAASAFAKVSVFGGRDRVSPQWEPVLGKGLLSTRSTYDSVGARVEFENVLTRFFRTHNGLTVVDNTDRSPRLSFETMDNFAISDSWVLKGTMGGAVENPDFHAFWATAAVERDYRKAWFFGLNLRFYEDSGETNELLPYGVTAPPVTAFGVSASVRWIDGSNQASAGIGPYWTRYGAANRDTSPVSVLYSDRSWLWLQAAWSHQF